MNDIAQTNLREPEQVDWNNYNSGSTYIPPVAPLDANGSPVDLVGVPVDVREAAADSDGYLNYQIDFVVKGQESARPSRVWASTRPYTDKEGNPKRGNPNKLADFLRSSGAQAKPQTNSEYRATVQAIAKRPFTFVGDWEAKNRDTGEVVKGYRSFPDDPDRPGQKKAILRSGDVVNEVDAKGNILGSRTVSSEIMFANLRVKYFKDGSPKR